MLVSFPEDVLAYGYWMLYLQTFIRFPRL